MMKYLAILVAIIVLYFAISWSLDKQEIVECNKWKVEAMTMKDYYLTEWQLAQCSFHNLEITN